jgi:hypothetical protein
MRIQFAFVLVTPIDSSRCSRSQSLRLIVALITQLTRRTTIATAQWGEVYESLLTQTPFDT